MLKKNSESLKKTKQEQQESDAKHREYKGSPAQKKQKELLAEAAKKALEKKKKKSVAPHKKGR